MSKPKTLYGVLAKKLYACEEGKRWYLGQKKARKSDEEIWRTCPYGQYMLYIVERLYNYDRLGHTGPYHFNDIASLSYMVPDFVSFMFSPDDVINSAKLSNAVRKHYKWPRVKKALDKL